MRSAPRARCAPGPGAFGSPVAASRCALGAVAWALRAQGGAYASLLHVWVRSIIIQFTVY